MRIRELMVMSAALVAASGSMADSEGFPSGVIGTPGGRYVYGQVNRVRADQYLLDTQTGRMWTNVCIKNSEKDPSQCALQGLQPVAFLFEPDGWVYSPPFPQPTIAPNKRP